MLSRLVTGGDCSLAVIGLAKNAGKTTVLNALAMEASRQGMPTALMSIGVDGEERDVWSGREKPPVRVPSGFLTATASPLLEERPGDWEILAVTSLHSALGPIAVAKALRNTTVKLAGVTTVSRVQETEAIFREHGTQLTLVDGAYDRRSAASPLVTRAAVCVVGASLAKSLDDVVDKTRAAVQLLTLPIVTDSLFIQAGERACAEGKVVGVGEGKVEPFPMRSLLAGWDGLRERLTSSSEHWQGLALPGALTDAVLERLISLRKPLALCLAEPTRCFVSLDGMKRYARLGGEISCLRSLELRAVAINPISPEGWSFNPMEMQERIEGVCGDIPVIDVMRECQSFSD
ncbi:hypothetical protein SAMN05444487_10311 [Marininema mesophilum]|uniref:Uncharacterized protein n=1 Tax=Marininema mesophilum TaxID=1048340 RepID=A0A1H2T2Z3_9BACL|nr:hypothetical protein [Marininema mesophilum]SDW38231.1 hypothetical protein SAMN05444487_10311 [Marininema mesophilum]